MNPKITEHHRSKTAYVYVRQSTLAQVRHHQESTERQYALREKAQELGWSEPAIRILDRDLGMSMANYQFMEQLLGLAVLAKILNEQSRRPFRPRPGYGCSTLGAGRRPFCGRRVRSC